jgi:uroporphyrinogen decarboxylase
MSPRERWLATLNRRRPDRVPMDYWATGEANRNLMDHMGCKDMDRVYETLHIDRVVTVSGRYTGPKTPEEEDIFGCRYKDVEYSTGVYREVIPSTRTLEN